MTTRIYKLYSPSTNNAGVYIGATKQQKLTLPAILGDYRKINIKKPHDPAPAIASLTMLTGKNTLSHLKDLSIMLLETVDNSQADIRKKYHIMSTRNVINKNAPLHDREEYVVLHSEEIAASKQAWKDRNPDYAKEWVEANRGKVREADRERYKKDPAKFINKASNYYETHKDDINAKRREARKVAKQNK